MADKMTLVERVCFACSEQFPEVPCAPSDCPIIRVIKSIDPETLRPKGRWELMGEADYKCSVCGFRFTSGDPIEMFPYCRCGCKMEG